jgi:hypothetical protein
VGRRLCHLLRSILARVPVCYNCDWRTSVITDTLAAVTDDSSNTQVTGTLCGLLTQISKLGFFFFLVYFIRQHLYMLIILGTI